MASSNQTPDVLFSPIAANADASDINTIPQTYDPSNYGYAAQNVGFPTECRLPVLNPDGTLGQGRAPRMQDWNGIMKLVSSHNFFLQNGGSYTFNPTVSSNIGGYPKNAVLWYFPENEAPCLVYSLINDNTNNFVDDPTLIDGIHWEMLVNPSSYANIALTNSPYTTNRILEIPQNIKLELSNGTLTLKAGSKTYVPNGFEQDGVTPKFDIVTIENDKLSTHTQPYDYKYIVLYNIDTTEFYSFYEGVFFSGPTQPVGYPICVWYDTNNNIIKLTNNSFSTWTKVCFPLGIIQQSSSGVTTSIDQVFNGFGYIGSTVFALPMKGQATTAINIDGTVTSTIWETTTVQTLTLSSSGSVSMSSTGVLTFGFNEVGYTKLADVTYYSSKIQGVDFYGVSFVANSNASNFSQAGRSYLSGLGMPSSEYEDWTLGASGSTYTAPANGYLTLFKFASGSQQYAQIRVDYRKSDFRSVPSDQQATPMLPLLKGETATVEYNLTGVTTYFRFIYAEGEK